MIWLFTFVCIVLRWYGTVLFSEMKTNAFLYCKRCKLHELIFFNVFYCSTVCRCPSLHILTPGLRFFIIIQPQRKAGINWKTPIIFDYKEWQIFRCSQLEDLMIPYFVLQKQLVTYISNLECHWQLAACWSLFFIYVMHHQLLFSSIFMPSYLLYTL
jgi:hypothetical protein